MSTNIDSLCINLLGIIFGFVPYYKCVLRAVCKRWCVMIGVCGRLTDKFTWDMMYDHGRIGCIIVHHYQKIKHGHVHRPSDGSQTFLIDRYCDCYKPRSLTRLIMFTGLGASYWRTIIQYDITRRRTVRNSLMMHFAQYELGLFPLARMLMEYGPRGKRFGRHMFRIICKRQMTEPDEGLEESLIEYDLLDFFKIYYRHFGGSIDRQRYIELIREAHSRARINILAWMFGASFGRRHIRALIDDRSFASRVESADAYRANYIVLEWLYKICTDCAVTHNVRHHMAARLPFMLHAEFDRYGWIVEHQNTASGTLVRLSRPDIKVEYEFML